MEKPVRVWFWHENYEKNWQDAPYQCESFLFYKKSCVMSVWLYIDCLTGFRIKNILVFGKIKKKSKVTLDSMPHLMVKRNFAKVKKNFFLHWKKIHIKSGIRRTTFWYRRKKLRLSPMHQLTKFGFYRKKTAIGGFLAVFNRWLEKSPKIMGGRKNQFPITTWKKMCQKSNGIGARGIFPK